MNYIFLVCHIIKILLTEFSRSVWENLDLRVLKYTCVFTILNENTKCTYFCCKRLEYRLVPETTNEDKKTQSTMLFSNSYQRKTSCNWSIWLMISLLSYPHPSCDNPAAYRVCPRAQDFNQNVFISSQSLKHTNVWKQC